MRFVVVGNSVLYDYILAVTCLPQAGEAVSLLPGYRIPGRLYRGGTAFNVAAALSALGGSVRVVHPVGEDFSGSPYEAWLRARGIDLTGLYVVSGTTSGRALVVTDASGESQYYSAYGAAASSPTLNVTVDRGEWLVVCPLFTETTRNAVERASAAGVPIAAVGIGDPTLISLFAHISYLFVNEREAWRLAQAQGENTLASILPARTTAFITRGRAGSLVVGMGRTIQIDPVQTRRFRDPTGAGDAFAAGTLAALARGYHTDDAAKLGAATASFVVESMGAQSRLPSWERVWRRAVRTWPELRQAAPQL